jgi:IMP dehydrogenase
MNPKKVLEQEMFTFNDVLIRPLFSEIESRELVNFETSLGKLNLKFPVICANMDTIVSPAMCHVLAKKGATGCLHRFFSIEDNVKNFKESIYKNIKPIGSIGISKKEFERAEALIDAGCEMICIDVANGAQAATVKMYDQLRAKYKDQIGIIIGNFATAESISAFKQNMSSSLRVDAFKCGIGGGSACLTRIQAGVGIPQLSAVLDCVSTGENIISDGGHKIAADVCKAMVAGAKAVMIGGMLAGTDECPGELVDKDGQKFKKYRGSASEESYIVQGKVSKFRTAEGDSFLVKHKGSADSVLSVIEGGLRSSFTYCNSVNLTEYYERSQLVRVSHSTILENGAHGKKE